MGVTLTKIIEKMELRNLTPDVDMTQREVKIPDINRPALQLAGFFDHFDCERIQLIATNSRRSFSFFRNSSPVPPCIT